MNTINEQRNEDGKNRNDVRKKYIDWKSIVNPMIPVISPKQPIEIVDYLDEIRKERLEKMNNSPRSHLSEDDDEPHKVVNASVKKKKSPFHSHDKYEKEREVERLKKKARKLENSLKKKERKIEKHSNGMYDLEETSTVNNMLIDVIETKLAILEGV